MLRVPLLPILFSLITVFSQRSLAFPESVRHGYLSCTTCHLSPSGRGMLTAYGKTLAYELYSFKKVDNANESLEAEAPWWQVGGRARLMQLIEDNKAVQVGRFFPMQTEAEAAIDKNKWAMGLSVGLWRSIDEDKSSFKSYLRNAYLLWRIKEDWVVRAGKFRISHGLGLPDHIALVNEELGWSHSHETQNIEVTKMSGDDLVLQASWILPSRLLVNNESFSGVSIDFEKLLQSEHKVGLNISRFKREGIWESQVNLHSVMSLADTTFLQWELAHRGKQKPTTQNQYALFTRLSHEYRYGLRPFIQWEQAMTKQTVEAQGLDSDAHAKARNLFVGTEWFPMIHTDVIAMIGQETESDSEDTLVFTLIGHFYF